MIDKKGVNMSKYIIKKNDGSIYEVDSLSTFCKEVGITERLLRYTNPLLKGKKGRYQEWHKGYKICSNEEIKEWKREKEKEREENRRRNRLYYKRVLETKESNTKIT